MLHAPDAVKVIAQLAVSGGAGGQILLHKHLFQLIKCVSGGIYLRVTQENMRVALGGKPAAKPLVYLYISAWGLVARFG